MNSLSTNPKAGAKIPLHSLRLWILPIYVRFEPFTDTRWSLSKVFTVVFQESKRIRIPLILIVQRDLFFAPVIHPLCQVADGRPVDVIEWICLNKDEIVGQTLIIVYDVSQVCVSLSANVGHGHNLHIWNLYWISFIIYTDTFTYIIWEFVKPFKTFVIASYNYV